MIRYLIVFGILVYGGCGAKAPAKRGSPGSNSGQDVTTSSESTTPTVETASSSKERSASESQTSSEELSRSDSSSRQETESFEPVEPVELPRPLCKALPALPTMGKSRVVHWLTIKADMLGASDLVHNGIDFRLGPQRVDVMTGRRPIILDFSDNSICAYASPFGNRLRLDETLPITGGDELLAFFQGGPAAVMGRYSRNGTRFQELPGGTSGATSKLVQLEAKGDRDACIATAFSDYELHLSFDQGEHWTPPEDTPYLENLGMLLDRKGEYLWSYSIVHPLEGVALQWFPTDDLLNPKRSGTTFEFGDQWESGLLSAAIAHPHKDSTLIVGSGTRRDPGPIVGEIGLDENGEIVPMRVLWRDGAKSPLKTAITLWADPKTPGRLFVGGFPKKPGDAPLLIVQDGKLQETVKFPKQEYYELRVMSELNAALPNQEGILLAGVGVGHEVRLYLINTK